MAIRLGVRPGIPVAVGTNDMAAAQMGAHNDRAGQIMNTAGSSDMVSILIDRPVTNPGYYLRNAALPGLWQIYATTAGGFGIDWFREQFCRELDRVEFNQRYLPDCIERFAQDTEVSFDPYLTGDRQSLERRTGAWHGLTLAATRDEMLSAMLKSMNRVLYRVVRLAGEVVDLDEIIKLTSNRGIHEERRRGRGAHRSRRSRKGRLRRFLWPMATPWSTTTSFKRPLWLVGQSDNPHRKRGTSKLPYPSAYSQH